MSYEHDNIGWTKKSVKFGLLRFLSGNIIIVNGVMVLALVAEFYNSFNFYIYIIYFFNVMVAWLAFFTQR